MFAWYSAALLFPLALGPAQGIKLNGPLVTDPTGEVEEYVFTPDGSTVFYSAQQRPQRDLFRGPADGSSAPVRIDTGGYSLAMAPDGSRVAYVADVVGGGTELRSVLVDALGPITLHPDLVGNEVFGRTAISSDSQWVVYEAGQLLLATRLDGSSSPVWLEARLGYEWQIGPTGTHVLFRGDLAVNGRNELFTKPIDGSAPALRLNGPLVAGGNVSSFRVSADGSIVVFMADAFTNNVFDLFVVPAHGGAPPLHLDGDFVAGGYAPSPDAVWVVFAAGPDGVYAARPDGSAEPVKLNDPFAGATGYGLVAISPDSQWVVYRASISGNDPCFVVPIDRSSAPRQLGTGPVNFLAVTPDSQRVVHATFATAELRQLFVEPIDGSAPAVELNAPLNALPTTFTLDSSAAVFRADGPTGATELFAMALDGGSPAIRLSNVRIDEGDLVDFRLSPDGAHVFFRADQRYDQAHELWSARLTGAGWPQVLNGPLHRDVYGFVSDFRFDPTSGRVVYRAMEDTREQFELYSAGFGFADRVKLNAPLDHVSDEIGDYSVANGRVVYRAYDIHSGNYSLFAVPSDGSAPAIEVDGVPFGVRNVREQRIAPDGQRAVFLADDLGGDTVNSVLTDGSSPPVRLSDDLGAGEAVLLSTMLISPDGARVVYAHSPHSTGVFEIFSVLIDGSATAIQIGDSALHGSGGRAFAFSPDAEWLVYTSLEEPWELFSTRLDGSAGPHRLSLTPIFDAGVPAFEITGDSSRVVYLAAHAQASVFELFSVAIDGSAPAVRLNPALPADRDVLPFALAPDAGLAVYLSDQTVDQRWDLYTVPVDGSAISTLLVEDVGGPASTSFAFTEDSSRIVYASTALYVVPSDGSAAPTQLSSSTGASPSVERFQVRGEWVAYAGDLRVTNTTELFSVALDGSQPQVKESGPLVFGGDVLSDRFALVSDEIVVYMADQDTNGHPELYFSLLQPIPRLGRAQSPSASRSLGD